MRKINIILMAIAMIFVVSCKEEDSRNVFRGGNFAEFGADNGIIIIDPSQDTDNVFTVGVTQSSTSDRTFAISVDPASTIDPSFYTLNETGTIAAGSFAGNVTITTFATETFPASGSQLILNYESVSGTDTLRGGSFVLTLDFEVACPDVNLADLVGTHDVVTHRFAAFFGDEPTRTVVEGPGENQITIVEGAVPTWGGEELILNVDPETGSLSYGGTDQLHLSTSYTGEYAAVFGRVLTCIGLIEITAIQQDGLIDNWITLQKQ